MLSANGRDNVVFVYYRHLRYPIWRLGGLKFGGTNRKNLLDCGTHLCIPKTPPKDTEPKKKSHSARSIIFISHAILRGLKKLQCSL